MSKIIYKFDPTWGLAKFVLYAAYAEAQVSRAPFFSIEEGTVEIPGSTPGPEVTEKDREYRSCLPHRAGRRLYEVVQSRPERGIRVEPVVLKLMERVHQLTTYAQAEVSVSDILQLQVALSALHRAFERHYVEYPGYLDAVNPPPVDIVTSPGVLYTHLSESLWSTPPWLQTTNLDCYIGFDIPANERPDRPPIFKETGFLAYEREDFYSPDVFAHRVVLNTAKRSAGSTKVPLSLEAASKMLRLANAGLAGDCGEGVVYAPIGDAYGMIRIPRAPEFPSMGYLINRHDLSLEIDRLLKENGK